VPRAAKALRGAAAQDRKILISFFLDLPHHPLDESDCFFTGPVPASIPGLSGTPFEQSCSIWGRRELSYPACVTGNG